MNTGKLNRRITYTTQGTYVSDGFGGKTLSEAGSDVNTWCSARQLSMRELLLYGLPIGYKTFEFSFYYERGSNISQGMKLTYESEEYRTVQITEIDEAKRTIKIVANNNF